MCICVFIRVIYFLQTRIVRLKEMLSLRIYQQTVHLLLVFEVSKIRYGMCAQQKH